jgi:hypothetical protein
MTYARADSGIHAFYPEHYVHISGRYASNRLPLDYEEVKTFLPLDDFETLAPYCLAYSLLIVLVGALFLITFYYNVRMKG